MARVCVHLAEGFEEMEAVTVIDILRRAEIEALAVSVTGEKTVTGSHGIAVTADILFEDVDYEDVDMLVLPGGMPGSTNLADHEGLKRIIARFAGQGKFLAAICAAPLVLGQMGLLRDKSAACFPGFEQQLEGALIKEERVVQSQNYITSRGPGTALEFAFKLAELIKGPDMAKKLREKMLAQ